MLLKIGQNAVKSTFFETVGVDSVARRLNALVQLEVDHIIDAVDFGFDDLPRWRDEVLRALRLAARDFAYRAFRLFAICHTSVHFR